MLKELRELFETDQLQSQRIVRLLIGEGQQTIPQIAKMAGTTEQKIKNILAGKSKFDKRHLDNLTKKYPTLFARLIVIQATDIGEKISVKIIEAGVKGKAQAGKLIVSASQGLSNLLSKLNREE